MLEVTKNNITLTRGDTARFNVSIHNDVTDLDYEMDDEDILTFTLKKKETDSDILIQKEIVGNNLIHITPDDTSDLSFGKYVYDIQLTTSNGDVYTIIGPSTFELSKEVTY